MSTKGPKPPASGNYEVGYGKPPVHTRFRKGQSGNPRGSIPKRTPTERANWVMLQEAYRPVTVREGERTMRVPAIAAIFRSQLASGLKGNGPAQRASLRMIKAIEGDIAAAKLDFLKVMIDYKAEAEIEIERRRKLGITDNSDIDPHPDDVLIDLAMGEVHVIGELNPKDNRKLRQLGLKR
jgi:hypothetical protein